MPQMTGLQLAKAIEEEWPDLPVILATGYAELTPGEGADLAEASRSRSRKPNSPTRSRASARANAAGAC